MNQPNQPRSATTLRLNVMVKIIIVDIIIEVKSKPMRTKVATHNINNALLSWKWLRPVQYIIHQFIFLFVKSEGSQSDTSYFQGIGRYSQLWCFQATQLPYMNERTEKIRKLLFWCEYIDLGIQLSISIILHGTRCL